MSTNKNAILRYQTLDRCFRNSGKRYYINDLLDACNDALMDFDPTNQGVKKRQLYDDIRFMESEQGWAIPLDRIKDGRKSYFRYQNPNFSINNQPINDGEAEQIKSAMLVLSRFKGMPQFEWVNELLPKLDQSFNLTSQSDPIMSFETNEFLEGLEYLTTIFKAIQYKQSLYIGYQSFKSKELKMHKFHPYHLKQYNNRWFLFGKQDNFEGLTNLALDRIKSMGHSAINFDDSQMTDFEEFFEDVIGVSKPECVNLEKIILRATNELAPYITTKPLHGSQKKIKNDMTHLTLSIEVIPNFELEKLILSFGEEIEVLEPLYLRNKIKSRLASGLRNYN